MEFLIYIFLVFLSYYIYGFVIKLIGKYNDKNEKLEGYTKDFILTKRALFLEKEILIDVSKITMIHIGTLSVVTRGEYPGISKLSLNIFMGNNMIYIAKKENVFKFLKSIRAYDDNLYERLISKTVLVIPPIRMTLERELDNFNE